MTTDSGSLSGGAAPPDSAVANRVLRHCPKNGTRYNRYTPVHAHLGTPIVRLAASSRLRAGAR